jgi:hypothetical protein
MVHNVANCLNDFESAVSAGDQEAAYAALFEALHAATAVHKGKPRAAAPPDADVLEAIDSAKAAVQSVAAEPQPPTPAGANPAVGGLRDELWAGFLAIAPALLDWVKQRLGV